MLLMIAASGLLAILAVEQDYRNLILPESRHIAGVIVDQDGSPVPDARIDHTYEQNDRQRADQNGKFDLLTSAPAVVIRKQGFRSERLQTRDAKGEVHITLQKLSRSSLPVCPSKGKLVGLAPWTFQFPKIRGVSATPIIFDIDYFARSYSLSGNRGIRHGVGPSWDFGLPQDSDVWSSTEYQEVVYEGRPKMIIDARGRYRSGLRWRYLGTYGESARYTNLDDTGSMILDQIMDGACLKRAGDRRVR